MKPYIYNLGQLFNQVAINYGSRPGLKFLDSTTVTYAELERLSNQLANYLLKRGIKPGNVVAILNNKTTFSYSTMLACIKVGAIYTNLDYNSPVERLKKMIALSDPALIFCPDRHTTLLEQAEYHCERIIEYTQTAFAELLAEFAVTLPAVNSNVTGDTPAYLMFTSGSTGFPKGVIITHANVLNFIAWSQITYNTVPDDIFTNINPMHFDNSVFDFYASLFTGSSLVPVTEELAMQPRKLLDALNNINPTIWFSVPSMLVYVLRMRALRASDLPGLRIVTFGGEGFPKNQLRNLWDLWGARVRFINVYGPTEGTCICSSYLVSEQDLHNDELLPLGPMAPNFGFLILNDEKAVAEGHIGELYIKGPNVALGYYNNPEKTREVFIQNPQNDAYKEIVYKSGDLVQYNSHENLLYFCGRIDNQIKRMGYRIELEEIENALGSLGYIEENAVIYIKSDTDNGKIIVCLASANTQESIILSDLTKLLPPYMLPNEFRFYEHLPKNQNGKIDRLKLKEDYVK